MQTAGKYYLWLNCPSSSTLYWGGDDWTADPRAALFFDREADALAVEPTGNGEVIVARATRDL